jgi:hypothetical protein
MTDHTQAPRRGGMQLLPALGLFAGALVHSMLPRGAFGANDVLIRAAITAAAVAVSAWLLMLVARRGPARP